MTGAERQMSLVGFMQAGNVTVYAGSWRHPATEHGFLEASYYQKLGRILEEGCFDLMFFDDRLAMPGIYGGSVADAVRLGARPVKLDLSIVLGLVAGATQHIGLGATYSTTYYSPFHVARTFATLDHLSGGRAAWNVVTSVNDGEAQNFGVDAHPGPRRPLRPGRRVPPGHDRPVGHLGGRRPRPRPGRRHVRRPRQGPRAPTTTASGSSVRGPLTVPRSPQGRPVLLQAGSSGRGRDFAAQWAELIFTGDPGLEVARSHYKDQKDRIAEMGRDPDQVRMLPMAYTVVGESHDHASEQRADAPQRPRRPDGLAHPAVRADEPRLLVDGPRRPHHRRAGRVRLRHPGPGAEPPHAHRRRPSPSATWPATGPPCCRAPASWAPAPRWPTRWRSGSTAGPATAS